MLRDCLPKWLVDKVDEHWASVNIQQWLYDQIQRHMNVPEAQEQHVVEFVFAEGSGDGDEEGLSEQRRACVVVARLFVLLPQVHWDHYMVCILHPIHRQLESAERSVVSFEVTLDMLHVSSESGK